jgi:hypothetical protein
MATNCVPYSAKGIQVQQIDTAVPTEVELPSDRETNKVLTVFDKEVPFSGRISRSSYMKIIKLLPHFKS